MTLVENIADQHLHAWTNKARERIEWEVSSIYLETLHLPEQYDYLITSYGLLDKASKLPIKSFMERETPLGKVEFDAFEKIETWAMIHGLQGNDLTAIWISPPHVLRSEDTKIIFNKIVHTNTGPVLRNYCLLFECSDYLSLDIANDISQNIGLTRESFIDTETLRATPFLFHKQINLKDVYEIILKQVKSNGLVALNEDQEDQIHQKAHAWARNYISSRFDKANTFVEEVAAKYSVSCPSRMIASEYLTVNGEIHKFVKNCGNCGVAIETFIPKGYRCKECGGVYQGC